MPANSLQIVYRSDLKHLCEVCKRLYHVTIPYLYKPLILSTTELSIAGLVTAMEKTVVSNMKAAGRQLQTSEDEYNSHSGLLVPTDYLIFRFSLWGASHSKAAMFCFVDRTAVTRG